MLPSILTDAAADVKDAISVWAPYTLQSRHIRLDLGKLKDSEIGEVFKAKIGGKLAALSVPDSDVDTLANSLQEVLHSAAEELLGRQRKTIQRWVTNEAMDLCDQRRRLRQQKYTSTETGLEYRKVNREIRKKMKAAKEEWTEEQCKNTEKEMMSVKQQRDLKAH